MSDACSPRTLCALWELGPQYPLLVLLLSAFLPLSIVLGRGTVRRRRLVLLEELRACAKDADPATRPFVQRSLDFVRARYLDRPAGRLPGPPAWLAYVMPITLFATLNAVGFSSLFLALGLDKVTDANLFLVGFDGVDALPEYQAGTLAVVAAAFLGAYVWSVQYLVLRVANDDLNPLSFLRVSAHILLTVLLAGILRHVAASGSEMALVLAAVFGTAFLMGLFPGLGVGALIDRLPGTLRLKRPVARAGRIAREFPLDLIDGIDSSTKFRLASLEVADAQVLATADPVRIYLESPYGLLQILDWIAQAQLLVAVGPERHLACREANVRDVLGLLSVGRSEGGPRLLASVLGGTEGSEEATAATLRSVGASLQARRLICWRDAFASIMEAGSEEERAPPLPGALPRLARG